MTAVFRNRNFELVGGLQEHIQALKEMIIYPLLYRELFDSYGIQAPRGVLFYGPPGTGKTLMAGAVASECSKCCSRKISFYMRKGGECLNKYVGESEKHLQNLFDQAYRTRPSIIFFDEIDGLVPTRSDLQEQVHASVVSTLLALMDGLDTQPDVFVIGATNRIDMIDPALRRPGRFDRELYFPLPPLESRLEIFKIHTINWKHKPSENSLLKLAAECSGYCGADIQALCSQAVMQSFNRCYPQAVNTNRKHHIAVQHIHVKDDDFWEAKEKIVPASQRMYILPSRPLSPELEPLLKRSLEECLREITNLCPFGFMHRNSQMFSKNKSLTCPRYLLFGSESQSHIAPAILHSFDHLPVVVLDLTTINEDGKRNSDSCSFVHKVEEARQSMPSIIYLRSVTSWWGLVDDTAKQVLISSLESLDTSTDSKIFIFGTASVSCYEDIPVEIKEIFPKKKCFKLREPDLEERRNFFRYIVVEKSLLPVKSAEDNNNPNYKLNQKNLESSKTGRLRNGKSFRQILNEDEISISKKIKLENGISASGSRNDSGSPKKGKPQIVVDLNKLEKLVDAAIKVTATARVNSLVRLYEELEIVSLKYSSKPDRSLLPEELQREISIFRPT